MQHAQDDESRPNVVETVRRERVLRCSIDDAWALLRDADGLERWLADEVDLVIEPGERGVLRDGDTVRDVVVESVEEGRRLSLRWWTPDGEPSVVDLTLDRVEGRTRLVVTDVPLRLVGTPAVVPATWTMPDDGAAARGTGPQSFALASR